MRAIVLSSVLVGLIAASGVASAQETSQVTFYGHVFASGLDSPMPSNAQPPEGEEVFGVGAFHACAPPGSLDYGVGVPPSPNPQPGTTCDTAATNKLALFSSAGFVDVKGRNEFLSRGDYTLFHNERGNTKAIELDPAGKVSASLWMTLDVHAWPIGGSSNETDCYYPNPRDTGCLYPSWGWDPAAWPDWVVKATLYAAVLGEHGEDASTAPPIRQAIESGSARVIAEGETAPTLVVNGIPGNPNVHQFVVDLGHPLSTTIEREEDFFLVFSWYSKTGDTKWSWHHWRLWAGEFFPPVYTLPVKNAFDVELVIPNFVYDKLVLVGVMNTPWGSYDVDPAATTLTIAEKGSGREVTPFRVETFADYSTAHGGHYKPVNQTWVWDYRADRLPPGTYTATISAMNWAHSARGTCTAEFTILAGGEPGPVTVGECGDRTASDEFVETVANLEGGGRDAERSPSLLPGLPLVGVAFVLARARGGRWRL